ncbi:MAG: hypothetical protein GX471_19720 [Candidatus Microthrix parvicella]|nr:hypothetical protein [Candidatus Microthrix parvicella]
MDYPFDEPGWDPRTDLARVEALRAKGNNWRTVCWVPSFFTAELMGQVGDLVRLDHLLPVAGQVSQRFREATSNLSPEAREQARPQLEAQQNAARSRLVKALGQAYGVSTPDPATIDTSHGLADHFPSLRSGFAVRPPQGTPLMGASLLDAFQNVVTQALAHSYPAAPELEGDVGPAALRRVLGVCEEAIEAFDGRVPQVPPADRRTMRSIANPLKLGVQSEQAFTLDVGRWDNAFTRKLSERAAGGAVGEVTVGELRAWIDDPEPMGLTRQLQNLVLIVWVAATDRSFRDHGGPAAMKLDSLGDHLEVVADELPDAQRWAKARSRAERVLGVHSLPDNPSAVGLARLGGGVRVALQSLDGPAGRSVRALERLVALVPDEEPARLRTARAAETLTVALGRASGDLGVANALVEAELNPSAEAVAASLSAADSTAGAIEAVDLGILGAAFADEQGVALRDDLAALLGADELAAKLAPGLSALNQRARSLVLGTVAAPGAERADRPGAAGAHPAPAPAPAVAIVETLPGTAGGPLAASGAGVSTVLGRQGLSRIEAQAALGKLIADLDDDRYTDRRFDVEVVMRDGSAG